MDTLLVIGVKGFYGGPRPRGAQEKINLGEAHGEGEGWGERGIVRASGEGLQRDREGESRMRSHARGVPAAAVHHRLDVCV